MDELDTLKFVFKIFKALKIDRKVKNDLNLDSICHFINPQVIRQ